MIEVMVSMLLTAIATSGIIALYVVQSRASGFSRHSTEATVLAQDQMERLRTSTVTGADPGTDVALDEHGTPGAGLFTRTYLVTPGVAFDDMRVDVSWVEEGDPRVVTLFSRRNR